jgi:hypothetical protein
MQALQVVSFPELLPEMVGILLTQNGPDVIVSVLALAHPEGVEQAAELLADKCPVTRMVEYAVLTVTQTMPGEARKVASLLVKADRNEVESELHKAAAQPLNATAASALLEALAELTAAGTRFLAGYTSDLQTDATDDFNVGADVATLCAVILSQDVEPPLSIGLFGDWGSGKTFFMDRMRDEVKTYVAHPVPKFHSRVAQITFNAWHYVDANLWASLVSHIFEQLLDDVAPKEDPGTVRRNLLGALAVARELKAEAQQDKAVAEKTRSDAEKAIQEIADQRTSRQLRLADLRAYDLWQLAAGNKELKDSVEDASRALGLPAALNSLEQLDRSVRDAHTLAGRAGAFFTSLAANPNWKLLIAVMVLIVGGFPLLAWAFNHWFPQQTVFTSVASFTMKFAALASAAAALIREPLSRVNQGLARLEQARQTAHELVDRKRSERSQEEIALERELNELRAREASATQQLTSAEARIQEVEAKIKELDEGRSLARYLVERFEAGDYRKYLGIISTIRRDFEKLAGLLKDTGRMGGQPIERIILYVDDLDRCPAERVVDVLQAVHLLLAFPLFVVVVGVDPRWVLRALERSYPAFRARGRTKGEVVWNTTPQNYLEKIFHIPFAVKPMQAEGFGKMIRRLLPATAERVAAAEHAPDAKAAAAGAPGGAASSQPGAISPQTIANGSAETSEARTAAKPSEPKRPSVDALRIRSWESSYAEKLFPFIS